MASNINPNNIDGAYPVAGQDNNSQGFRDNFTNIKTNFQFSEDEINDLQTKVILKSALVGQTLNNNMSGALLQAARIQNFSATVFNISQTTVTVPVNYSSGHYQTVTTAGSITLAFSQFPGGGNYGLMRLQINITNVSHTVTLPADVSLGIEGIQGISPGTAGVSNTITFADVGKYEFAFGSNNGSTITVFDLNRPLTNFSAADLSVGDLTASGNVSSVGFTSAIGNVVGGNLVTGGRVVATGNVTGGNITTSGVISTTGTVQAVNVNGTAVNGFINPTIGTPTSPAVKFTTGDRLSSITAGAVEYDGAAFTAAVSAGQRGVIGLDHFRCVPSSLGDIALTNGATAQAVFGSTEDSITLAGSTTYFLEALYVVGPNTGTNINAVTMSTVFAVTSALASLRYTADSTVGLFTDVNDTKRKLVTAPTASVVTDAAAGGNESYFTVLLKGIMVTGAATTVTPQIAFSGVPAVSGVNTLIGSYLRLSPIGNGSVTSVGNWS